jgi:hypothetical protein
MFVLVTKTLDIYRKDIYRNRIVMDENVIHRLGKELRGFYRLNHNDIENLISLF